MSQPDLNPYASPDEKSAPLTPHRGSAAVGLRLFANAAFVFALVGPPIAWVCALSGINFGLWEWLDYVTPPAFALLLFYVLYLAAGCMGVLAAVGSLVATVICAILGRWRQRVVVVVAWIAYFLLFRYVIPLLIGR